MSLNEMGPVDTNAVPGAQMGYNHNFRHAGRLFHIQTEDSGPDHAHIYSHIFFSGTVIASRKTEYEQNKPCSYQRVRALMRQSHRSMCVTLRDGAYDERIEAVTGCSANQRRRQEIEGHSVPPMADAANSAPQRVQPPQLQAVPDPAPEMASARNTDAVQACLGEIQQNVAGFLGAAVVDQQLGTSVHAIGDDLYCGGASETAALLRKKMAVLDELSLGGTLEDILISLEQCYCVIRPVQADLFVYALVDRVRGNLAMARRAVSAASLGFAGA